MILVNSISFFERSKEGVEEFCKREGIARPDKIIEKLSGIAFRWKAKKVVLMIGDDAKQQGASKSELFARIMDENMMGAIHFISKDYAKDELIDFLERWFPA